MKFTRTKILVSLLLCVVVLAGCKDNPTIAEACVAGPNGGNPVIIVGGTFSLTAANELFLGNAIEAAGYTHCVLELKGTEALGEIPGTMNVIVSAGALMVFVDEVLAWSGASKVDLIGHSQGVLAARSYIKTFSGEPKVGKLISLAAPNMGIDSINLIDFFVGPVLAPFGIVCEGVAPCVQMQEGSAYLTDLNAGDMTPGSVEYYAFYTEADQLAWRWDTGLFGIPFKNRDTARLTGGATNVSVGDMCPLRVVGHVGMIADPVPLHMTLDALAGNPISVPLLTCLLPPVVI